MWPGPKIVACCLIVQSSGRPTYLVSIFGNFLIFSAKCRLWVFFIINRWLPRWVKYWNIWEKLYDIFFFLCNFKGAMTLYLPWQVTAIRGTLIGWHNSDGRGGREGEEGRCRALSSLCNICIQAAGTSDFIRYVDRLSLYIPCSSYIYTHFSEKVQPLHVLNRTNIYTR